jgi:D-sedoheptulose 7-phosphate isomerase
VRDRIAAYFETLDRVTRQAECTALDGEALSLDQAFARVLNMAHGAHDRDNKIIFAGNGGSAGICSHMAIDFSKNGGMRATALNDSSALTALGNDLGYENVFAKQIEWHGRSGDMLIAISSSGRSPNIIKAAGAARSRGCGIVTFSGFTDDNPLRRAGDVNFYIRAREYGFVEVAHQALIHAILDLDMGWKPEQRTRATVAAGE